MTMVQMTFPRVSLAVAELAASDVGNRCVIALGSARWLSAQFQDVSEGAASSTAVVKVRVGSSASGPFIDVPSGCIGTGGTATMGTSAPLAGPIDVGAFAYAALVITTAEASKYANLTVTAKSADWSK